MTSRANAIVSGVTNGLVLACLNGRKARFSVRFECALLGLIARWIPARRALPVAPMILLQEERLQRGASFFFGG